VSGEKPREIALNVLGRRGGGDFIEDIFEKALAGADIGALDRRLCQELVYGIVRWQATLDWLIGRKTANRVQKAALQDLLRLGLYQIFWLDRVPSHAAVHVTVELAKRRGFGSQAGFVNALLRGYLREFDATKALLAELKQNQPAIGFSHPDWLLKRWESRWGPERTRQLLEWNNTAPKTFARINTLKADPGKLLEQWRDEGVEYDFVRRDWLGDNSVFELKAHPGLESLPSFQQGQFYIQDPSTLLAVWELAPQPGERLLDLCAAPGGKLSYAAQLMRDEGRLVAYEVNAERLQLLRQNCLRLGITCMQAIDPGDLQLQSSFDKVLLDAPCSNTGVMRRRVDLRWRVSLQEIQRLRGTQQQLLELGTRLLNPGGVLIYSTCSLEVEENEDVVRTFLERNPNLRLERQRQLLPFVDGTDGAFVAQIKRAGEAKT